jgi:hypothetical protein
LVRVLVCECAYHGLMSTSYRWYLYLDAQGGECVIGTEVNLASMANGPGPDGDDSDDEEDDEVNIMDYVDIDHAEVRLHATGFEEFLIRTYFAEWASFFGSPDDDTQEKRELPQALREHLYKAFSDRGRALA